MIAAFPSTTRCAAFLLLWAVGLSAPAWAARTGVLELQVVDRQTGEPLACRMHLKNERGKPVRPHASVYWHDHFVVDGSILLKLPVGNYTFELERGPEYLVRSGHFRIENFADDSKTVDMQRFCNLASEGWWSGDLNVQRPPKELPALLRAEDLHLATVVDWSTTERLKPGMGPLREAQVHKPDQNRYFSLGGGSDARSGGRLSLLNLTKPLPWGPLGAHYRTSLQVIDRAAGQEAAWIDAASPLSPDLPLWLAQGRLDSIALAEPKYARSGMEVDRRFGRRPDDFYYPGMMGEGRWAHQIYYHALNCGFRLPPSAGSGSGEGSNPVGYNRVYVYCGDDFNYERWFEAFREGKAMVTNGPLIRPSVEGHAPGHTFTAGPGQTLSLEVGLTLSTRDRISYVEIVKDGQVVHEIALNEWKRLGGKLPPVVFDRSGWFLVRAVTDVEHTYRFATTAPYYVEIGDEPRISATSVQFFLEWLDARTEEIRKADFPQRDRVLSFHAEARKVWEAKLDASNAE